MALKLKAEYAGVIIGFRNSSLPLGQRSEADLMFLYQRALDRNFIDWLAMFEDAPDEKEVELLKEKSFAQRRSAKSKP